MPEMPEMPETFDGMSDAELSALGEQLQQIGAAYAAAVENGDSEAIAAVETAAAAFRAVLDEQAHREQERQETAARVEQALAILNSATEPVDTTEVVENTGEADTTEAAFTATDADTAAEPVTGSPESSPEPPGQSEEQQMADLDLSHVPDPTAALALAAGQNEPPPAMRVPAVPRRSRYQPRQRIAKPLAQFTDLGTVDQTLNGKTATRAQIAKSIADKFDWLKKKGAGDGSVMMFQARTNHPVEVGRGDPFVNTAILRGVSQEMAVAASGGNCAIPMNNYDVFNAAQPIQPIEGFVPVVGAEARGAMRYLSAPNWADARSGVTVVTNDEDIAGATKPCVHFDCPEELTCIVDAVPACAEFGNLTYRTAPELVEILLDQLAVAQAQAKEIAYLDALDAASTQVTDDANPYGAVRSSVWSLANAVFAYRQRNHIPHSVPLDVLAPSTLIPVLKADAVADLNLGMNFVNVDQQQLAEELFNSLNANVEFYFDYATADGPASAMQQTQGPGSLGNFPLTFKVYLYAPGTWVRLDGGVLNIGLIRDSATTAENNLQIWSEEYTVLCMVGAESVALELELCPSGAGPEPVTALTCTS